MTNVKERLIDYGLDELVATLMTNPTPEHASAIYDIIASRMKPNKWIKFDKNDKNTWPGEKHFVLLIPEGGTSDDATNVVFSDGKFYDLNLSIDNPQEIENPEVYFYLPEYGFNE